MKKIFLGMTGASGMLYAENILLNLVQYKDIEIFVSATPDALTNLNIEKNTKYENIQEFISPISNKIKIFDYKDFTASVSSGSFKIDDYIFAPASMGFIGRAASGVSSNLIERCIDVGLKESRNCVILFREMPLSKIHLANLLKLADAGAKILPAAPGFYHSPASINDLINFVTGKIFDIINIKHNLFDRWQ
jgi:4-hydroxy-3-polyprenylbenzoate decarboxylase